MKRFILIPLFLAFPFFSHAKEFKKDFGTYDVPGKFEESTKHSRGGKYFYLKKGDEDKKNPPNISVNAGRNRYSKENHAAFRQAIMTQLLWQCNGTDAQITGDGTYTEKDELLYVFTITEKETTTTQYYIVGDFKFVLVHETTFPEDKETDDAARKIVNSFEWAEN